MKKLMLTLFFSSGIIIPFVEAAKTDSVARQLIDVDLYEFKNYRNEMNEKVQAYEKYKIEEQKRIEAEQERLRQEELERQRIEEERNKLEWIEFELTFYTSLPSENGGYTVTCLGEDLKYGMVANNVLNLGTKIYLEGLGTFTNSDRGGNNFNVVNRLDVLIERNYGESDSEYLKRVNNMGRVKVMGYIVEE
jgi:3D (Asp-Asp-Asp) domain-containing protein